MIEQFISFGFVTANKCIKEHAYVNYTEDIYFVNYLRETMLLLRMIWYFLLHMISQITTMSTYHPILMVYSAHVQFVFSLSLKSPVPQNYLANIKGTIM